MARPSRRAERREDILSAAVRLIEQHDLATLRLTDIAAELGLTPNAVRYYFKDVDALLIELAMRSDLRFYDERRAAAAALEDPRDRLSLVIGAGLPTGAEDAEWRAIWRAFLSAGFELDQRPDVRSTSTSRSWRAGSPPVSSG
jgi:AcrR family transcriptional regulator